jgi:hypothetical protein
MNNTNSIDNHEKFILQDNLIQSFDTFNEFIKGFFK